MWVNLKNTPFFPEQKKCVGILALKKFFWKVQNFFKKCLGHINRIGKYKFSTAHLGARVPCTKYVVTGYKPFELFVDDRSRIVKIVADGGSTVMIRRPFSRVR